MGLKNKFSKADGVPRVKVRKAKNKSIGTKILATVLAILIFSLGIVSALFSVMSLQSTKSTAWEIMDETGKITAKTISNRLIRSKTVAQEVGTIARLSSTTVSKEEKLKILDNKIQQYGLITMDVADKTGKTLRGKNIADESFFKEALER